MSDILLAKPIHLMHTFHLCQLGAYICLLYWEWVKEKFSTQTQDNRLKGMLCWHWVCINLFLCSQGPYFQNTNAEVLLGEHADIGVGLATELMSVSIERKR